MGGHSSRRQVAPSLKQPTRATSRNSSCVAPIRSCTRWGLPCRRRCRRRGALLPHPFDLTRPKPGGLLSVALSLTLPEGEAAGRYPAPLFRGARTFLVRASSPAAARPSGERAYSRLNDDLRVVANVRFGWKADARPFEQCLVLVVRRARVAVGFPSRGSLSAAPKYDD